MSHDEGDGEGPSVNLAELAAAELGADILLINSPIMPGLSKKVRTIIESRQERRDQVVVILVTDGGVADDAYRAAVALRSFYDRVTICVAGWCKSAGTLLAISADALIFGCNGEMGPLDVQIAKKDELVDSRDSGLILDSAIREMSESAFRIFEKFMTSIIERSQGAITFRTAADLAANVTIGLMSPMFQNIDPLRMGADQRAQNIGKHYAVRLNFQSDNLQNTQALNMLLNGYPSHGFVIDLDEARRLFTNVKALDGHLELLVSALGEMAMHSADDPIVAYVDGGEDGKGDEAAEPKASETDPVPAPDVEPASEGASEELRRAVRAGPGRPRKSGVG